MRSGQGGSAAPGPAHRHVDSHHRLPSTSTVRHDAPPAPRRRARSAPARPALAAEVNAHRHASVRRAERRPIARVADWLLQAYNATGPSIPLPRGQQGLGEELGLSRVSVNRALSALVATGAARVQPRLVVVLEPRQPPLYSGPEHPAASALATSGHDLTLLGSGRGSREQPRDHRVRIWPDHAEVVREGSFYPQRSRVALRMGPVMLAQVFPIPPNPAITDHGVGDPVRAVCHRGVAIEAVLSSREVCDGGCVGGGQISGAGRCGRRRQVNRSATRSVRDLSTGVLAARCRTPQPVNGPTWPGSSMTQRSSPWSRSPAATWLVSRLPRWLQRPRSTTRAG